MTVFASMPMRFIYTVLFYLLLPFILLRLVWRSRRLPAYRQRLKERFGYVPFYMSESIWVHAVSLGETIAAIPLIKALQQAFPQKRIVVTNMTPTGAAKVKEAFGETVLQAFIPYDIPAFIRRLVKAIHPEIIIIMETELWPNLLAVCSEHSIPVVVVNARLSQQSARGYERIPSLNRDMFKAIHRLAAQADADAERFVQLGLTRDKIVVTGNMKFDLELPDDVGIASEKLRDHLGHDRLIWIAASTHPGEEKIILEAHQSILAKYPETLLMLVPRHPDRFNEVYDLIKEYGFTVERRSQHETEPQNTQVYLGDTMGELLLMYATAHIACVAGSFIPVGGHNMLEPAVLHKPILTGPYVFNFANISARLLEGKGMQVVNHKDELASKIIEWLNDENTRCQTGENAYNVVAKNRGALQRQLGMIKNLLR